MRISPWLLAGALLMAAALSNPQEIETEHFSVPMGMVEANFTGGGPSNLDDIGAGSFLGSSQGGLVRIESDPLEFCS